jgi:hypothetical protein
VTGDAHATGDPVALLSGYEDLRSVALLRAGRSGRGSGLALFLQRGMAAWITACAPLTHPLEASHRKPTEEDRVPADLRTEVAMVLAEMALTAAHAQGQGHSTC